MLPITIIAASSLSHAMADVCTSFSRFKGNIIARSGMSLVNEDPTKNVYNVIKSLKWREEQFVLWHDVLSNSIALYPQQESQPITSEHLLYQLRKLAAVNVVAITCMPRQDASFDIEDSFPEITKIMPYIKLRPLLSRYFRDLFALDDLHLHFEIEEHLIRRFFESDSLNDLMLAKRYNRNQCRFSKRKWNNCHFFSCLWKATGCQKLAFVIFLNMMLVISVPSVLFTFCCTLVDYIQCSDNGRVVLLICCTPLKCRLALLW